MVVMTAKVDKKKILVIVAAVLLLIVLIALLSRPKASASPAQPPAIATNEDRVDYLTALGWTVSTSPVETQEVRIPEESTAVYDRYNALQVSQGFDLTDLAGKNVMRYVYEITNYPNATEPVYATLLVYKNQVVGGDVTSTAADGQVHGLKMPQS